MRKLLRANAERVRKSGLFWGGMILWIVVCLLDLTGSYNQALKYGFPLPKIFQETMFSHTMMMGIIFAVFVSLFTGTEYSDGTIRNKLVVGQSRNSIYLSNYMTAAVTAVIQTAAAVIVSLTAGYLLMGKPEREAAEIFQACAVLLFLCMAYAAVYNLVSMLVSSKPHASIVNILLWFGMLFAVAYLSNMLSAPELMTDYSYAADGTLIAGNKIPNPNYVSGMQRDIYQFLMDFLPGGQNIEVSNSGDLNQLLEHPVLSCFYSSVIVAVCSFAGMFLFHRKDIK